MKKTNRERRNREGCGKILLDAMAVLHYYDKVEEVIHVSKLYQIS